MENESELKKFYYLYKKGPKTSKHDKVYQIFAFALYISISRMALGFYDPRILQLLHH
jgi:hypothetical protein